MTRRLLPFPRPAPVRAACLVAAASLGAACLGAAAARADQTVVVASHSDRAVLGLLVTAPEAGCATTRILVEAGGRTLASRPLRPGQIAIIRLGPGFAVGDHALTLRGVGCAGSAVFAARRVVLAKASPDHAWRAAADLQ
jgi:hypothetical protein